MTEAPYSLQLRHDGAWLTVKGLDYDEFYANLATAIGPVAADQHLATFAAERTVVEGLGAQPMQPPAQPTAAQQYAAPPAPPAAPPAPPAAPPAYNPYGGQPQAPAAPQGGDWRDRAPMCPHGQRRPYEGSNAKGTYRAYFCGAPKGTPRNQQCQPIDADTGQEWGNR